MSLTSKAIKISSTDKFEQNFSIFETSRHIPQKTPADINSIHRNQQVNGQTSTIGRERMVQPMEGTEQQVAMFCCFHLVQQVPSPPSGQTIRLS